MKSFSIFATASAEIYTALSAGVPGEMLYFHGNSKTRGELEFAVKNGVGRIVVDNPEELEILSSIAKEHGVTQNVYLRIKPGIDAHTHDFIRTGQIDSKFGFALETGGAMDAVKTVLGAENICLKGLHCHIGSQVFDTAPFVAAAQVMMRFIADVKKETGAVIEELDLGGGFGIKYSDSDDPIPLESYMEPVSKAVADCAKELDVDVPFILIEPGRSIVGAEGVTLYTVGSVKKIPGVRTYVSVDGGMTDNPRYILYQAEYTVLNASNALGEKTETVTVAGKCCESGDLIQENAPIQPVKAGDVLAVLSTGAYCYSMASNYNRIPRPEVVMVSGGKSRTVVRRETLEQLVINDVD